MPSCRCPCHHGSRALNPAPLLTNPVAAVTACDLCRPLHAPAVTYGPRRSFAAAPPPTPLPSADGFPYDPSDPLLDDDT